MPLTVGSCRFQEYLIAHQPDILDHPGDRVQFQFTWRNHHDHLARGCQRVDCQRIQALAGVDQDHIESISRQLVQQAAQARRALSQLEGGIRQVCIRRDDETDWDSVLLPA